MAGLDQWLAANLGPSPLGHREQSDSRQFSGEYRLLVLRVFFPDLPVDLSVPERTPRYTRQEVEDRFNTEIAELWARNSWGQVTLRTEVAPDVMLNYWEGSNPGGQPWPRALYTDGVRPWFNGNQIRRAALQSAISAFAAGGQAWQDSWRSFLPTMWEGDNFKWSEIDGVLVYIIDTPAIVDYVQNTPQVTWNTTTRSNIYFDSYRGTNGCGAATGFPGGVRVGCGSIMEGVGQTETDPPTAIWKAEKSVWGAWAHEVGHMLQEPGAGHPSRYQNRFELMDSNTPGQTGAYTRQSQEDFAGWMPADRMRIVAADEPGAYVSLSTLAYGLDQAGLSVHRAVRVELPGTDEYYMLSVRRQILGDELQPIPDEGLLIERVNPNGYDPVVHETACSRLNNFSLQPGEFCTFEIGFKPTTAGLYSGDLQLEYDNGRLSVLLDAQGVDGDNERAPLGNEPVGNPNELFMFPFTRTVSGNLTYNFGDAGIAPAAPPLVALITLRNNGAATYRSYLAFDLATAIPTDATIVSATLQISQTNIFGGVPEYRISVYEPISQWAETNLTWGNQPSLQDTGLSASISMDTDWQTINITQLAAGWVGGTDQVSLVLRSQDETVETAREFSSRHGGSPPELIVTYIVP